MVAWGLVARDSLELEGETREYASSENGRRHFLGPSMDDRIARDLSNIVSYRLVGDTLNLALKMDSGIYTWRRIQH
jgi:hypothetical protein